MPFYKNVASQKIAVFAWDTDDSTEKTGDAANITAQISKDGAATAATNDVNPTELDATDAPGIYIFDMTQAETNADMVILFAKSATSDIKIEPVNIYTDTLQSVANIADGVWDEVLTGHTTTDTAGLAVGNLPTGVKKNTVLSNFKFLMIDSADDVSGKTGLSVTATRSIDDGIFEACTNSVVEISAGAYRINLSAADLNGDTVMLRFSASGANDSFYSIKTEA